MNWNGVEVSVDQWCALNRLNAIFEEPSQFGSKSIRENFNYADIIDDLKAELELYEEHEESLVVSKSQARLIRKWLNSNEELK